MLKIVPSKDRRAYTLMWAIGPLVAVSLMAALWIGLSHYRYTHQNLNNVRVIEKRVGALTLLPTDEQPALATVTDTTKLQTNFLKQAQNGDKVLVYQYHKKIIIYRPSANKIVDIGPVTITPAKTNL
jgi:hypothetical protein